MDLPDLIHSRSFISFSMDSLKVEESTDDFMLTLEQDLWLEYEEENSYGAMDSIIMDLDINQLIKECADSRLSEIVKVL